MKTDRETPEAGVTGSLLTLALHVGREGSSAVCAQPWLSPVNSVPTEGGFKQSHLTSSSYQALPGLRREHKHRPSYKCVSVLQVFNAADVCNMKHIFTNKQADNES